MTTGVAIVSRDPLRSWKRTERVMVEAKRRGLEVGLALDPRDSEGSERLQSMADLFMWHEPYDDAYVEPAIGELADAMASDVIIRVDDDEEPSQTLWEDLPTLGGGTAYTIPIICELNGRLYVRGMEKQVRIFPRGAFHFAGGIDSEMVVDSPLEERPLSFLWHYSLYAPREWRESKRRDLIALGVPAHFCTRFMWEENLSYFEDMPVGMEEELPLATV